MDRLAAWAGERLEDRRDVLTLWLPPSPSRQACGVWFPCRQQQESTESNVSKSFSLEDFLYTFSCP